VITFFTPDNLKYLFTADTKSEFLLKAHEKYNLANLDWLQIPHHGSKYGSKYNIDKSVIEILNPTVGYISGDGSANYPNSLVVDALKAAKCKVYSTAKSNLLHRKAL
jgi:beta-lactamase superfamily II metal-dependent hydrolase